MAWNPNGFKEQDQGSFCRSAVRVECYALHRKCLPVLINSAHGIRLPGCVFGNCSTISLYKTLGHWDREEFPAHWTSPGGQQMTKMRLRARKWRSPRFCSKWVAKMRWGRRAHDSLCTWWHYRGITVNDMSGVLLALGDTVTIWPTQGTKVHFCSGISLLLLSGCKVPA